MADEAPQSLVAVDTEVVGDLSKVDPDPSESEDSEDYDEEEDDSDGSADKIDIPKICPALYRNRHKGIRMN